MKEVARGWQYIISKKRHAPVALAEDLPGHSAHGGDEDRAPLMPRVRQGVILMRMKAHNDSASALAEAVRAACIEAALLAYEEAGISGLCHDGRWEYALAAMRRLDLRALTGPVDG
jgi:hypothetical protein